MPASRPIDPGMTRPLNILSIQSHVAYGHVGNASAVFPMQRLGCEVWPIHTVQFSNHTGYQEGWTGRVYDGAAIDELVEGIGRLGRLSECNAVLSGYMGSADIGQAILSAVDRVRGAGPEAFYCCDPVIGDVGRGIFVRPGVPEFFRERAVPAADIITPNQFELTYLAGFETTTLAEIRRALASVHALGPRVILATSVLTETTPADSIDMIASGNGEIWRLRTPLLKLNVNGAGDAIAAVFLVHWLRSGSIPEALSMAGSSIFGVLKQTLAAGSRELVTIAAQEEFIRPSHKLAPERI
jgi:pyridoxine kinase